MDSAAERVAAAQAQVRAARARLLDRETEADQARADYRAAILQLTLAESAQRAQRPQPDPRHYRTS